MPFGTLAPKYFDPVTTKFQSGPIAVRGSYSDPNGVRVTFSGNLTVGGYFSTLTGRFGSGSTFRAHIDGAMNFRATYQLLSQNGTCTPLALDVVGTKK